MRRILISLAALAAVLAVPSLASAHTGSVACTPQGVVFSYNANFAHDTTVTENVNGVTKTFLVHAGTATTDTIPAPAASVIAGASWVDGQAQGSIPFTSLTNCTPPPPPDCVKGTSTNGVPTCPQQPTVCVPTIQYVDVPGPATTTYVNVPGAIQYVDRVKIKTKIVYRTRVKWKTRIKLIPYHEVKQPKHLKQHSGGVTG